MARTAWRLWWVPLGGWEDNQAHDRITSSGHASFAAMYETEREAIIEGERRCRLFGGNYSVKRKARKS